MFREQLASAYNRRRMQTVNSQRVPTLSIVAPVYNERQSLAELFSRLREAVAAADVADTEFVFVDDGSSDGSLEWLRRAEVDDPCVRTISLSRNFGHQAALLAGLEAARGQAVITLDGDLQHPPELIGRLVERWREGCDVVQAVRRAPADLSAVKRAGSRWFYRVLSTVTRLEVTPGAADYRLMSREAVTAFTQCQERCRFNRGLVQWIGFACAEVEYDAAPRFAGKSKYSTRAMIRLAGDAIFSFSSLPLRLAGLAGAVVSVAAAAYLAFVLGARLFTNYTLPGWSSILATVLILGGTQLIVLWILGEYVGRLYEEAKQRPIYIVRASDKGAGPVHSLSTEPLAKTEADDLAPASVDVHDD